VAGGLREAGGAEHRDQLGRGVDPDLEGPGVALAGLVDQRLRRLGDAADGVERALLEQQPALAEQLPAALGEGADEQVTVHGLDDEPAAGTQDARDLAQDRRVLLVAEVAERGVQVERGVERRVSKGSSR
jgi:hypothetical protein